MNPPDRVKVLAEIAWTYPCALRSLRRDDLPTMVRRARGTRSRPNPRLTGQQARETAVRLGRAVTLVMRFFPTDSRCLAQALVLTRMLSRRGIPTALVIGITPSPGFRAHAWLEHDGLAVQPPGTYSRLAEF